MRLGDTVSPSRLCVAAPVSVCVSPFKCIKMSMKFSFVFEGLCLRTWLLLFGRVSWHMTHDSWCVCVRQTVCVCISFCFVGVFFPGVEVRRRAEGVPAFNLDLLCLSVLRLPGLIKFCQKVEKKSGWPLIQTRFNSHHHQSMCPKKWYESVLKSLFFKSK